MGRIIGNIFVTILRKFSYGLLFFISTALSASAPDISMRMINRADGSPLTQAGIGQPFIIEVMVTDIARVGQYPTIKGIENLSAKNIGINIKTVNGRTTACYSYELRIDVAGTYDVGPAELVDGRQTLRSGMLRVVVGDQAVSEARDNRKDKEKSLVFMRLSSDKNKVVVGERITCSLRFYTSKHNVIKQLIEQEVSHLERKQMQGPYEGTERIDGTEYQYVEWMWYVYPKNAGKQVIPAYGADYEIQTERDNYWGGLGRFFGARIETKRVYSNAISVEVNSLPPHNTPIDAVGSFSSMHLIANPSVAQQGEGITVTIEITGDGDPDTMKCPVLRGLPDSLKWYESKKGISNPDGSDKKQVLSFEFVVQGLKQGNWQIPTQSFHFYDVNRREYRTLKSAPVPITITPGIAKKNNSLPHDLSDGKNSEKSLDSLAPLHTVSCGTAACDAYALPWWFVMVMVLIPVAGLGAYALVQGTLNYRMKMSVRTRSARAFSDAHSLLHAARGQRGAQNIYRIIVGSIAARCVCSPAHISADFIEKQLQKKQISPELLTEWRVFFEKITHSAYSNQSLVDNQLLSEAEQWLKRLNEYFPVNEF